MQLGDQTVKPGRTVHVGELLRILKEGLIYDVTVVALSARRGPATEAVKLYSEAEASRKAREEEIAIRRAAREAGPVMKGRPTKKTRRALIHYFAKGRTDG